IQLFSRRGRGDRRGIVIIAFTLRSLRDCIQLFSRGGRGDRRGIVIVAFTLRSLRSLRDFF
ncbi:MAG: hypothetical protein KDD99_33320, partial [Bacteroidetes bacterium]|nr:hypothetical protein [Bacteroidota bacterium]